MRFRDVPPASAEDELAHIESHLSAITASLSPPFIPVSFHPWPLSYRLLVLLDRLRRDLETAVPRCTQRAKIKLAGESSNDHSD
jgi:hypothetical protein